MNRCVGCRVARVRYLYTDMKFFIGFDKRFRVQLALQILFGGNSTFGHRLPALIGKHNIYVWEALTSSLIYHQKRYIDEIRLLWVCANSKVAYLNTVVVRIFSNRALGIMA